jgi:hypothetical protein
MPHTHESPPALDADGLSGNAIPGRSCTPESNRNPSRVQEALAALKREFVAERLRIAALKASHGADSVELGDDLNAERDLRIAAKNIKEARELGAAPANAIPDGKFHSFPIGKHKDHGWYIYHDGAFPAGAFGDWRTGASHKWRLKNGATKLTPADRTLIKAQQAEREAEEAKRQGETAPDA